MRRILVTLGVLLCLSSFVSADAYKSLKKRAERQVKAGNWYEAVATYERMQELQEKKSAARKLEEARLEAARMKSAEIADQLGQWEVATVGELARRSRLDTVQALVDEGLAYSRTNHELLEYESSLKAARDALLAREERLSKEIEAALAAEEWEVAFQHYQALLVIDRSSEIVKARGKEWDTQVTSYCRRQRADAEERLDIAAAVQSSRRCAGLSGGTGNWETTADFYEELKQASDLSEAGEGEAAFETVKTLAENAGSSSIFRSVGGSIVWRHAEERQHDIGLYRQYLELFPEGEQNLPVRDCLDWAAAEADGTIAAFTGYIAEHPAGRFLAQARRNLELLGTRKRADRKTAALLQTTAAALATHGEKLITGFFCRNVQSTSCGFDLDEDHPLVIRFGESDQAPSDDTVTYEGREIPLRYSAWTDGFNATIADRSGMSGFPGIAMKINDVVYQISGGAVYYDAVLRPEGVEVQCSRGGVETKGEPSRATVQSGTACEVDGATYSYEDGRWLKPTELPRIFR